MIEEEAIIREETTINKKAIIGEKVAIKIIESTVENLPGPQSLVAEIDSICHRENPYHQPENLPGHEYSDQEKLHPRVCKLATEQALSILSRCPT